MILAARMPRWRSLLFVPAHVERFTARAHERGADAVILDLEDAVPLAEKPAARARLHDVIGDLKAHGCSAMVRVNHHMRWVSADLDAAVYPGLDALVLPKVEDPGFIRDVADAVEELERERAVPAGTVKLIIQIETPTALGALSAIASAHHRVAAMTLGPEDYSAALGGIPDEDTLFAPNYAVLCAARAAGILPLGFVGSIAGFSDPEPFARMAQRAQRMGFRGAMAIHPAQVELLNAAFTPTKEELTWARQVLEGSRLAEAEGRGAFQLAGRMVDAPVIRRARETISLAD